MAPLALSQDNEAAVYRRFQGLKNEDAKSVGIKPLTLNKRNKTKMVVAFAQCWPHGDQEVLTLVKLQMNFVEHLRLFFKVCLASCKSDSIFLESLGIFKMADEQSTPTLVWFKNQWLKTVFQCALCTFGCIVRVKVLKSSRCCSFNCSREHCHDFGCSTPLHSFDIVADTDVKMLCATWRFCVHFCEANL